jgi:enterochelin esterase family protein
VLKQARPLIEYVPDPCFGAPQILLIVFDGVAFTRTVPTPTILDNLIAGGQIPSTAALFIDSRGEQRNIDLPCNDRFAGFLAHELLPWIESRHGAYSAEQTVLAGASYGGLCSAYAAFRYPERFGNVLSMSGSYWAKVNGDPEWGGLPRLIEISERLNLRFYLDVGRFEAGNRFIDSAPCQLTVNRRMRDVLRDKGYPVTYREFPGGHDWLCWEQTLPEALVALVGRGRS